MRKIPVSELHKHECEMITISKATKRYWYESKLLLLRIQNGDAVFEVKSRQLGKVEMFANISEFDNQFVELYIDE